MEIPTQPEASGRVSLLVPDAPCSRLLGLVALAVTVAGTTLLIYPLREIAPAVSTGVVYLVAVLLLSTYWGLLAALVVACATLASARLLAHVRKRRTTRMRSVERILFPFVGRALSQPVLDATLRLAHASRPRSFPPTSLECR